MRSFLLVVLAFLRPISASGDVALLLNESTGRGAAFLTSAGHSAVYLSNICMASPVRLRLCEPGELGSVISNYKNFGETEPYEWNVSPLTVYLYGVEDPGNIPVYANEQLRAFLQEAYRRKFLRSVCPDERCGGSDAEGGWRDMVGGTFARDIYAFFAKTTPEQDSALVDDFNQLPNVSRYNGFTRNCADFARRLVNRYFPNSARPDHVNDFGMTSPKAIAKSFAHYSERHPELMFSVEKFTQLPGPIRRSEDCRKGTEVGFRSKKWLLPMLLRSHELAMFVAAYTLTGRFNPEHEYERNPTRHMAELNLRAESRKNVGTAEEHAALREARNAERQAAIGTRETWAEYKDRFAPMLDEAVREGVFRSHGQVRTFFRELERESRPAFDSDGAPILQVGSTPVGLTQKNILGSGSDRRIAYQLMLAKVDATLRSAPKNRESLPQFRSDWEILMRLSANERMASSKRMAARGF